MTYQRDTVPNKGTLRDLQAYLERTFSELDAWTLRIEQTITELIRILQLSGITISWEFNDDLDTTVDPGVRNMRGNTNLMDTWTQVSMSNTDIVGREMDGSQLHNVTTGDPVRISDLAKDAVFYYTMDAPIVDNGTWFQMDLTPIEGNSANPVTGDIMEIVWFPQLSDPAIPAGFLN